MAFAERRWQHWWNEIESEQLPWKLSQASEHSAYGTHPGILDFIERQKEEINRVVSLLKNLRSNNNTPPIYAEPYTPSLPKEYTLFQPGDELSLSLRTVRKLGYDSGKDWTDSAQYVVVSGAGNSIANGLYTRFAIWNKAPAFMNRSASNITVLFKFETGRWGIQQHTGSKSYKPLYVSKLRSAFPLASEWTSQSETGGNPPTLHHVSKK